VSCTKTAELIKMQFGMLSRVGPGNVLYGDVDSATGRGVYLGVWPIERHCKAQVLGLDKQMSCAKNCPILICTLYDVFLCEELPFGGRDDCTCIKNFYWH